MSPDGEWMFPLSDEVLEEVGMRTIAVYIVVRRQTIAAFIINQPIFSFCEAGERRHGTPPRQY